MGFKIHILFEKQLNSLPPFILSTYTHGGTYLEKITFENESYIGKKIGALPKWEELLDLKRNIISLITNLVPEYPIEANQIVIFSYNANNSPDK